MMKLSILILTVPSRIDYFYPKILKELLKQISNRVDIEILGLFDNKKRSVGQKRQDLLNIAQGEYLTFIDDDDRVSPEYIDEIMKALYENNNCDCVVYETIANINGKERVHCKYGVEYEYGKISDTEWRGKPAHTMIWKSTIAKSHMYSHINNGEDVDWVKRACVDIKTQVSIDKVLYFYDANYLTTSETAGLPDEYILNCVSILLMQNT